MLSIVTTLSLVVNSNNTRDRHRQFFIVVLMHHGQQTTGVIPVGGGMPMGGQSSFAPPSSGARPDALDARDGFRIVADDCGVSKLAIFRPANLQLIRQRATTSQCVAIAGWIVELRLAFGPLTAGDVSAQDVSFSIALV